MRQLKFRAECTPDEAGNVHKFWYTTDDVSPSSFWAMVGTGTLINVCQFTGLVLDKEVYEGDIVQWGDLRWLIQWNDDTLDFEVVNLEDDDDSYFLMNLRGEGASVIGNRYENKELLNV